MPPRTRADNRDDAKQQFNLPGDHCRGVPPVPIPNTEVKPSRADGTAL